MSINTLKKKTQAKYNNSSVGQNQFSLNGTHRSQGWVGQTMLSRSLPRTPLKGQTPKGYGGCCGTYNKKQGIIQSAVTTLNNNNIIKPSVISNKGMLEEKITPYRNYLMPYPYVLKIPIRHTTCTTVKSGLVNNNDAGLYTENLSVSTGACVQTINKNQTYSGNSNYNSYCHKKICSLTDVLTNKNGSCIDLDSIDKTDLIKGTRLQCDDYKNVKPDQYNEIYFKKGIQYNADGTYVLSVNPTNGGVLPGPQASY